MNIITNYLGPDLLFYTNFNAVLFLKKEHLIFSPTYCISSKATVASILIISPSKSKDEREGESSNFCSRNCRSMICIDQLSLDKITYLSVRWQNEVLLIRKVRDEREKLREASTRPTSRNTNLSIVYKKWWMAHSGTDCSMEVVGFCPKMRNWFWQYGTLNIFFH